jgi:hypothetical protein
MSILDEFREETGDEYDYRRDRELFDCDVAQETGAYVSEDEDKGTLQVKGRTTGN